MVLVLSKETKEMGRRVILGSTGINVNKNGFGALPVQRVGMDEACKILRKAYDNGIDYFDTARFYSDSEKKIGEALSDVRNQIYIATKTMSTDVEEMKRQLDTSLTDMKTDYIDVYQFHNPSFCPKPDDGTGLYEYMLSLKEQGIVKHIGFTNHRIQVAEEAVESGLYETLQFPFNCLSNERELKLAQTCKERNVGFIAMKALSGGLITNSAAAYAWQLQYDNVLPIWGIQRERELDQFLSYQENEPSMDDPVIKSVIEKDVSELAGEFCRGCGYCMPCPVGIEINNCARRSLLLRRAPIDDQLGGQVEKQMKNIENCIHCNQCKSKCPYGLDTPRLLEENYKDYFHVLENGF
ncbi:MAG: aldo/keto reductase [Eubacterium sp.]